MAEFKKIKPDIEKVRFLTPIARVSYPHLFKPVKVKDKNGVEKGEPVYSIELLFDKTKVTAEQLMAPVTYAAKCEWGPDKADWPTPFARPVRDGDKPYGKKKEVKPEHAGHWVVKASSSGAYARPHVVGRNSKVQLTEMDLYPGCYARAQLKAHAHSFGVKFILDGVQKHSEGTALGSKKSAEEMFGQLAAPEGEGEDDLGNFDDAVDFDSAEETEEIPF